MLTTDSNSTSRQKAAGALLTRREAARFVNDVLGRPMSFSTLQKLCAWGEGPPVASQWGRRPLYTEQGLREWAENRGRSPRNSPAPAQPSAAANAPRAVDADPDAPHKRGRPAKRPAAGAR